MAMKLSGELVVAGDLLDHACLRGRFVNRSLHAWEFVRDGETVRVEPGGPLVVSLSTAFDLPIDTAVAGAGVITSS